MKAMQEKVSRQATLLQTRKLMRFSLATIHFRERSQTSARSCVLRELESYCRFQSGHIRSHRTGRNDTIRRITRTAIRRRHGNVQRLVQAVGARNYSSLSISGWP